MRPEIVGFDVVPMARFSNAFQVNNSLNEGLQIWIVNDSA